MSQEGNGSSNGVNYAYTLSKDSASSWCYECRVHKNFLDSNSNELVVGDFKIEGREWALKLTKNSGNLGAYILPRGTSPIGVHAYFTVVNHADSKYNKSSGFYKFASTQSWGFNSLASIAKMKDPNCKFLKRDIFVLRVFMRLKLPQNESFSVSANKTSATCTWKLKDLHGDHSWRVKSEFFKIGELNWQLAVLHYGKPIGQKGMDLYIYHTTETALEAKGTVSLVSQSGKKDFTRDITAGFDKKTGTYRYSNFVNENELEDETRGLLKNGWITLRFDISIKDQQPKEVSNPKSTELIHAVYGNKDMKCLHCNSQILTSGVLHGDSTHKCYCVDCARSLKQRNHASRMSLATFFRKRNVLDCPVCGKKVERIIEDMA